MGRHSSDGDRAGNEWSRSEKNPAARNQAGQNPAGQNPTGQNPAGRATGGFRAAGDPGRPGRERHRALPRRIRHRALPRRIRHRALPRRIRQRRFPGRVGQPPRVGHRGLSSGRRRFRFRAPRAADRSPQSVAVGHRRAGGRRGTRDRIRHLEDQYVGMRRAHQGGGRLRRRDDQRAERGGAAGVEGLLLRFRRQDRGRRRRAGPDDAGRRGAGPVGRGLPGAGPPGDDAGAS